MKSPKKRRATKRTKPAVITAPIAVTDADFAEKVLNSSLPVVVDFWAEFCGPCRAIAPHLVELAALLAGQLVIAKVDTKSNSERAKEFNVQGLPTLLFFHQGKVVNRILGGVPKSRLRTEFESFLVGIGAQKSTASAEAQAEFDAIVATAEIKKDADEKDAGDVLKAQLKEGFDALDACRADFLKIIGPTLPDKQAAIAARGAVGEFDEAIYNLFAEHRSKIDQDPQFADISQRQQKAIEFMNSPDKKLLHTAFFAAIESAGKAYDVTVEAARKRLLRN